MSESPVTVLNAHYGISLKIYTVRIAEVEPKIIWSLKKALLYRLP